MKIDAKQVFLYAITPALITGLFTVAPKAYEVLTEPKANLVFSMVKGPQIAVKNTQQQIILIRVANTGKRALTMVRAKLSMKNGSIIAHSLTNTSGLSIQDQKFADGVEVTSSKVHPGESFAISALLNTTNPSIEPSFILRSDEVLGIADAPRAQKKGVDLMLSSAGFASMSVFTMALITLRRIRSDFKSDIIYYIAVLAGIATPFAKNFSDELTYMRFADMLLALGQAGDNDNRYKAISGLKSLLLVKDMMKESQSVIERNLRTLLGDLYAISDIQQIRKRSVSSSNLMNLRNLIDEVWIEPCAKPLDA
jgi:hypothetical protein